MKRRASAERESHNSKVDLYEGKYGSSSKSSSLRKNRPHSNSWNN